MARREERLAADVSKRIPRSEIEVTDLAPKVGLRDSERDAPRVCPKVGEDSCHGETPSPYRESGVSAARRNVGMRPRKLRSEERSQGHTQRLHATMGKATKVSDPSVHVDLGPEHADLS